MSTRTLFVLSLFALTALSACSFSASSEKGGEGEEKDDKAVSWDWAGSSENSEEKQESGTADLKKLFPKRLNGMERGEMETTEASVFGLKMAAASVEYGDREKGLSIDLAKGSFMNWASMGIEASDFEVNEESGDGYKRTIQLDGHKAIEQFDRNSGKQELVVFVDDFVLNLEGWGLDEGDLRKAFDRLDLGDLVED